MRESKADVQSNQKITRAQDTGQTWARSSKPLPIHIVFLRHILLLHPPIRGLSII